MLKRLPSASFWFSYLPHLSHPFLYFNRPMGRLFSQFVLRISCSSHYKNRCLYTPLPPSHFQFVFPLPPPLPISKFFQKRTTNLQTASKLSPRLYFFFFPIQPTHSTFCVILADIFLSEGHGIGMVEGIFHNASILVSDLLQPKFYFKMNILSFPQPKD